MALKTIEQASRARRKLHPADFISIYLRDSGVCQLCQEPVKPDEATLDHILPFSRGGTCEHENLALAHRRCNLRKHNRTTEEYLRSLKQRREGSYRSYRPPGAVDLAEAARRLGLTTDAVRKRIKRGQLLASKGEGGRWYVHLDAVQDRPDTEPLREHSQPGQLNEPDADLVDELKREVARLERDLDWHKRMMAELVSRVPQLPERTAPASEAVDVVDKKKPRPWWQVWRR